MLRVKNYTDVTKATTEAAFEKRVARAIKELDWVSWHISHAFEAGWPDRYLPGGTWIELKSLKYTRHVTMGQGLSPAQERKMAELSDRGDRVFYLALINHTGGGQHLVMCPWGELTKKRRKITVDDIPSLHKYPKDLKCLLQNTVL